MICKTDSGAYVISAHQVWRPGAYDSEKTAKYAFQFTDEELRELQRSVSPALITMDMLKALRSKKGER